MGNYYQPIAFSNYDKGLFRRLKDILATTTVDAGVLERMRRRPPPWSPNDPAAADSLMAFQLLRLEESLHDHDQRDKLGQAVAASEVEQIGHLCEADEAFVSEDILAMAGELETNGICNVRKTLNAAETAAAVSYINGPVRFENENASVRSVNIADIVKAPHLLRFAMSPQVLGAASQYLGAPATLLSLTIYHSLAHEGQSDPAQELHRDYIDYRACSLYTYLCDVGPTNGPHVYVEKSHRHGGEKPTPTDRFNELQGPAGLAFLESPYGLHFGKRPTEGTRYLFQALFGLVPYSRWAMRLRSANVTEWPRDVPDNAMTRHALRLLFSDRE